MNILVTGGAGFFGSKLAEKLLEKGYNVTVYDKLMYDNKVSEKFTSNKNYRLIVGDVTDHPKLEHVIMNNDIVVHLAALVGEPVCKRNKDIIYDINTLSTQFISDVCKNNNKQLVFLSTCSNYGKNSDIVNEKSELNPLGLYSDSKIKSENYIIDNLESHLILRCATLFGISHRMRIDLTINQFIFEGIRDGYIGIFGEMTWRPFLYVDDACNMIILAVENKLQGVYNLGDDSLNFTKRDIVDNLKKCGMNFDIKFVDFDDPRDYRVDFSKIKSALNYTIQFPLDKGIECVREYMINNWDSLSKDLTITNN
jgi:nucleoside-diphosphate-sugar epimerase